MDKGRIAASGSPADLIEHYATREVLELRFHGGEAPVERTPRDRRPGRGAPGPRAPLLLGRRPRALEEVRARGIDPLNSLVRRSTLEDVFLSLTGRTLVD